MHHQLFSEYLKAGNLLKLKNLKETGTVCKLKYFLIYRESYRHRNIEQCYRISHILLIVCVCVCVLLFMYMCMYSVYLRVFHRCFSMLFSGPSLLYEARYSANIHA